MTIKVTQNEFDGRADYIENPQQEVLDIENLRVGDEIEFYQLKHISSSSKSQLLRRFIVSNPNEKLEIVLDSEFDNLCVNVVFNNEDLTTDEIGWDRDDSKIYETHMSY